MKLPRPLVSFLAILPILLAPLRGETATGEPITLGNETFRYTLDAAGRNVSFVDRATGRDYLRPGASPCALVRLGARDFPATSATFANDRLTLRFVEPGAEAVLKVESRPAYVRLTVESLTGAEAEAFVFLNVPLTLQGLPTEAFGACALSLNLRTRVDALPALQSQLRAAGERRFGITGAQVAIVGRPMAGMLPALKEVLTEAKDMPPCPVAGPWAAEIPFNHGSYLFNFGTLVETNVDEWIGMARSLGFTQIDSHGGGEFFRFGDFELNRKRWPEGWDTWRRIADRLHGAGLGAIFHTYAFFIDKRSKYVTPVPDPRLDAFRSFTLAADVSVDATELPVNESTAGLSTVTGFFEHNSVILHLGDELVTFSGFSREAPWRFTGVKRGALGTKAAAHSRGARARHLKECFGLLVPNVGSSLFEEIAANHADVVNRCGFDGVYLDAIDGSSILRGADECWYWADKFVFEIQKRLQRPVGMEMSSMWHHFWQYRTRWQAWDYPQRGHARFVDQHAAAVNGGLLLPLHLGWWNFQSFNPPQIDPTYPEVMELLAARLVGWDAGISLTGGVDREKLRSVPLFRRAVDTLRRGEELRHSGAVDAATRQKLREPGSEFALVTDATGRARFQHQRSVPHTLALAEPDTLAWSATNLFPAQPLRFRLEALMSVESPGASNAVVLLDPAEATATGVARSSANGVTFRAESVGEAVPGGRAALLSATNSGQVARNAAWLRMERRFSPTRNLKAQQAIGVWVDGDGQGELLAIRLESPAHLAFGAVADRYLPINFTGPRFVTLVETESTRWNDYVWNDGKGLYNVHRETIEFGAVESASVWLQNLAPGRETRCRIGPVLALPMKSATLRRLALTLNGEGVELPVELSSGQWLEYQGGNEATIFGPQGETIRQFPFPRRELSLRPGRNELRLVGESGSDVPVRARFTVFSRGEVL